MVRYDTFELLVSQNQILYLPFRASTRAFFDSMAMESLVVRSAIMAFAAMQMQRSGLGGDMMKIDWRPLYDSAARHLSSAMASKRKDEGSDGELKHILASLFLLVYTDVSRTFIALLYFEIDYHVVE